MVEEEGEETAKITKFVKKFGEKFGEESWCQEWSLYMAFCVFVGEVEERWEVCVCV